MWADSGRRWAPRLGVRNRLSALVVGDLLDKIDDAPAQLGIADAGKRLGQRQPVRGGEKIGHIGGRGRLTDMVMAPGRLNMGRALEKECDRHLKDVRNL